MTIQPVPPSAPAATATPAPKPTPPAATTQAPDTVHLSPQAQAAAGDVDHDGDSH
jgi:hypothetical protein